MPEECPCARSAQLEREYAESRRRHEALVARLEEQIGHLQRMEPLGELVSGISHDFNNLLAVILGEANLLLESLPDGAAERKDAECILEAAEQASWLTKQLLTYVRRESAEPTVLDLNAVVERTDKMLRRVIGEEIDLALSLGSDAGGIRAGAGDLEQVLMNLAANARDAIEGRGRISIRTRRLRRSTDAGGAGPDDRVELSFSDTGRGMPAEIARKAFEPFFTTKALGKGTGLGLSTCAAIVRRIGGQILADSEPGRGTVITVVLPRIGRPAETACALPDAALPSGHETILVIEDDERVGALVSRILQRAGYRVLAASSGEEALRIGRNGAGPIDLILSDVVVPDISGPEIVNRLRETSSETRALFMSGHANHTLLQDGVLQAAAGFIQKPFAAQALARKVRDVLDADD